MATSKNIALHLLLLLYTLCTACGGNVEDHQKQVISEGIIVYDTSIVEVYVYDTIRKIVPENARNCVERIFAGEVGVLEVGGNNRGSRIGEYLAATGLGQGYAYCAAFICWGFDQCDVPNPHSAWSPTVAMYNVVYTRGDEHLPANNGLLVAGLYYKTLGRIGHVLKIVEFRDGEAITIEGNTNGAGSREGDGVHRKVRPTWALYKISDYDTH